MAIHSSVHFIISLATRTQERKRGNFLLLESWWATRVLAGPHFLPWDSSSWEDLGYLTKVIVVLLFQSLSCVQLFTSPWTAARQAFLSFTISRSLFKLMCIELVMPSNHLILCCPLLLLPSIFPSFRVFSKESAFRIRWPSSGASTSASVLPMTIQDWFHLGLTGLISLLSKGLLYHHSSKALIFWFSAFFDLDLLISLSP